MPNSEPDPSTPFEGYLREHLPRAFTELDADQTTLPEHLADPLACLHRWLPELAQTVSRPQPTTTDSPGFDSGTVPLAPDEDHDGSQPADIPDAVREAIALPIDQRPARWDELVRWVKIRLYGYAPLRPAELRAYVVDFGMAMLCEEGLQEEALSSLRPESQRADSDATIHRVTTSGDADAKKLLRKLIGAIRAENSELADLILMKYFSMQDMDALARLAGRDRASIEVDLRQAESHLGEELASSHLATRTEVAL